MRAFDLETRNQSEILRIQDMDHTTQAGCSRRNQTIEKTDP